MDAGGPVRDFGGEPSRPSDDGVLDEAYERLRRYGPEFEGYLSNHGPMVVEVLQRRRRSESTHAWLDQYTARLEPAPSPRWTIAKQDWREALGDPKQLGDWIGLFDTELREQPWKDVLATWWPRLVPGAVASATHGLIRTGHALRSLEITETEPRLAELGLALGYWAARYQPLPLASQTKGYLSPAEALAQLPRIDEPSGGAATRLLQLNDLAHWPEALASLLAPAEAGDVPAEMDALVDAAVSQYLAYGSAEPVMLVHAATAPAAAAAALPSLPTDLWCLTWDATWNASAAITACYAVEGTETGQVLSSLSADDVLGRAVESGDPHVIKFADVALLAHERGNSVALSAASHAACLIQ
jgi:hypothetical protein